MVILWLKTITLRNLIVGKGRLFFKYCWPFMVLLISFFKILPRFFPKTLWTVSSIGSGGLSILGRYVAYSSMAGSYSRNVYFGSRVVFKNIQNSHIGENVSIHDFCYVDALGGIDIGDNVSIAHSSSIITFNHTWDDLSLPIKYNPVEFGKVIIKNDVWIGCGVRIMPGVVIGERSVIAAGAVVVKDVPPRSVVAGVPAKLIKNIE